MSKPKKAILLLLAICVNAGLVLLCVWLTDGLLPDAEKAGDDFERIKEGMSRAELVSIVGEPHNEWWSRDTETQIIEYHLVWRYHGRDGGVAFFHVTFNSAYRVKTWEYDFIGPNLDSGKVRDGRRYAPNRPPAQEEGCVKEGLERSGFPRSLLPIRCSTIDLDLEPRWCIILVYTVAEVRHGANTDIPDPAATRRTGFFGKDRRKKTKRTHSRGHRSSH